MAPTRKLWQYKLNFLESIEELHTCIDPNQILIDPTLVKPPSGAMGFFSAVRKALS